MTNQEAFDTVVRHLYEMKKRSIVYQGGEALCAYRGVGRTSCAIGCLIPDKLYYPSMEGAAIIALSGMFLAIRQLFDGVNMFMLASLQCVHDEADNWDENGIIVPQIALRLREIAEMHYVDPGVIRS